MNVPVVTAAEAIADGLRPSALFSVAKFNERLGNTELARQCRLVGREMASIVGLDIGGRRKSAANNNRPATYGKPRSERRAA